MVVVPRGVVALGLIVVVLASWFVGATIGGAADKVDLVVAAVDCVSKAVAVVRGVVLLVAVAVGM